MTFCRGRCWHLGLLLYSIYSSIVPVNVGLLGWQDVGLRGNRKGEVTFVRMGLIKLHTPANTVVLGTLRALFDCSLAVVEY